MPSKYQRNTGNKEESLTRIAFDDNLAQLTNSDTSTFYLNTQAWSVVHQEKAEMTVENEQCETATPKEIIDILHNPITRVATTETLSKTI